LKSWLPPFKHHAQSVARGRHHPILCRNSPRVGPSLGCAAATEKPTPACVERSVAGAVRKVLGRSRRYCGGPPIAVPGPMVRHVDEALPSIVEVAWHVGVKREVKRGGSGVDPVFRLERLRRNRRRAACGCAGSSPSLSLCAQGARETRLDPQHRHQRRGLLTQCREASRCPSVST
jgi:hypothetical protein